MSTNTNEDSMPHSEDLNQFPTARVVEKPTEVFGLTRLWWLALACLVLAVGLVVWSLPPQGTAIKIAFPEGHGLRAEDAVRYRGIDVGVVESVRLNQSLEKVEVDVRLLPSAKKIAVEGSRFWIVRPQLSLSGVSGLETAVGHKYIEAIPGPDDGRRVKSFDGLTQPPVDSVAVGGIEILLRADARHSVSPGSAIHYRGVDVGRIMGVDLSPDARHVEVRGKVFESYRGLVTTQSRFWATGGVDVDFSLREGLKLETESLDTLARGGVSMLVVGRGQPVVPGHVFPLAATYNEDWIAKSDQFQLTTAQLRGCVNLEATWKEKVLFRDWKKSQRFTGIALAGSEGQKVIVIPADVFTPSSSAVEGTFAISVIVPDGQRVPIALSDVVPPSHDVSPQDAVASTESYEPPQVLLCKVPDGLVLQEDEWISGNAEAAFEPTKSLVVRQSSDNGMHLHLPIELGDISLVGGDEESGGTSPFWQLQNFSGDRAVWHGCPVLDASNSALLGILLIDARGPRVLPVP